MHPLEKQVRAIGAKARRLLLIYGGAGVLAIVVGLAMVLGLIDYLLRLEDTGLRLISSAALVCAFAAGLWFFLRPAMQHGAGLVETAQQIERRFPQLHDKLSSTMAFLHQSEHDPTAGSRALRMAVVSQTVAEVETLPLHSVLDAKGPRRMILAAVGVFLLLGLVCLLDVRSTALAAQRLATPWAAPQWPKRNQLTFVDPPERLAAGEDLVLRLVDQNERLPREVAIEFWFDGDSADQIQTEEMHPDQGAMSYRLNNVARSLQYRAIGGDDTAMVWRNLEVVEPPEIENVALQVTPPQYTGWSPYTAPSNLRVLQGSQIDIEGQATKPLSALHVMAPSKKEATALPATIASDGVRFSLTSESKQPWIAAASGAYRFQLVDKQGLASGSSEQWNLRVITDQSPTASIDSPSSNTFVTAGAVAPLSVRVKDDLRIAAVDFVFIKLGVEDAEEQVIPLIEAPPSPPAGEVNLGGDGDQRSLEHQWDLSRILDLSPGESLEGLIRVVDFKGQVGESGPRRFTIISTQEFEDRLAQRRAFILSQLAEVLSKQRIARGQTQSLEIQLNQVGSIGGADLDLMQGAELNQRQIRDTLITNDNSIEQQIVQLLTDLENNRIDSNDTRRAMSSLLVEIRNLEKELLPGIAQGLVTGLKNARDDLHRGQPEGTDSAPASKSTIASFTSAGTAQDEVIRVLEELLGELSQWDNYRRLAREVARIKTDQHEINEDTEKQRLATLTKQESDLTEQESADLTKLSQRQLELSRRVEKLIGRMRSMESTLTESDPLAAETVADGVDTAERTAIAAQMRESGRQLERNQIAQAGEVQKHAETGLQELLNVLSNRREHELARIAENLRAAAGELDDLKKQQEELRSLAEQAAKETDEKEKKRQLERLTKQQREAAEKTHRLARRLERLQAQAASQSLEKASDSMAQAGDSGEQGQADQAQQNAEQSELELEQAAKQLQQAIAQAEQELLEEQLARLEHSIEGMIGRQQALFEETIRLGKLLEDQGEFDRAEKQSVYTLAAGQRHLAEELDTLSQKTAGSKAFQLGLDGASREMLRAAARLDRATIDNDVQQAQQTALSRLKQLLEAIKPNEDQPPEQGDPGAGQGGGGPDQQQNQGIEKLAEFRLLKLLQEEINRRTVELENVRRASGELTDEQVREAIDLAEEQGKLADLLLELSQPMQANPEDDPENLPDFREDNALDAELQKRLEEAAPLEDEPPGPEKP